LIEAVVGSLDKSAAHTEVQTPAAQQIDQRIVFGQPQRVVMREEGDRGSDTDFFGPLRDSAGDDLWCGTDVAAKVMLADPQGIEAEIFGVGHFVEEVLVVILLGAILGVVIEESQQTEFHRIPPGFSGQKGAAARAQTDSLEMWKREMMAIEA